MGRKKNFMKDELGYYITKFFSDYLPMVKGVTKNTISSYRDTIVSLLEYMEKTKKLNINNLSTTDIDEKMIEEYLQYLETVRGNSISTRNQRLAGIHSFYHYLQKRELSCFDLCSRILSIPNKKAHTKTLSYFSTNEIKILINMPDTKKIYGFRDYTLLLLLYETAARAQEISNLQGKQMFIENDSPHVVLIGKGNKERRVPLSLELSVVIKKYMKTFKIENDGYVFKNKWDLRLTTKGIEYILRKYIQMAKVTNPEMFEDSYSNHSMRHSRAMHLLEAGVNLIYIRDILGHTSIVTTEIYAKTNTKVKEDQIKKYSESLNINSRYNDSTKKDLLNYLKNIN